MAIVDTEYSLDELQAVAATAQDRLDAAGIEALVFIRQGADAIQVGLITPDGEPDEQIERNARSALNGLPAQIDFRGPIVPLGANDP